MRKAPEGRAGVASRIGDVVLTIAAVGGVVCIALVVLAAFFDITLIMFKTGSMGPTIPAGSLAIVREIPAADITVGDVVTVERPGALPVTHRVTSIVGAEDGARTITMRGDANPVEDPAPYTVTSVRLVLWSVPGLASAVVAASNPLVLGGVTIGASVLVTWAFWPRRPASRHAAGRGLAAPAAVLIVVGFVGAALAGPVPAARAAEVETLITGEVMRLMTVADNVELAHLVPGERVPWQVGVWAREDATGVIDVTLSASGALAADPDGLQVEVRVCDERWVSGVCGSGEAHLAGPGAASGILDTPLAASSMDATSERWINVDVWLPAGITTLPTTTATLQLAASGSGDSIATDSADLARAGTDAFLPLLLSGAAIGAGLLMALVARLQRDRREQP